MTLAGPAQSLRVWITILTRSTAVPLHHCSLGRFEAYFYTSASRGPPHLLHSTALYGFKCARGALSSAYRSKPISGCVRFIHMSNGWCRYRFSTTCSRVLTLDA
jgi:hypothetical protein